MAPDSVETDAVVATGARVVTETDAGVVVEVLSNAVNAVFGSETAGFDNAPKAKPANAGEVMEAGAAVVVGVE